MSIPGTNPLRGERATYDDRCLIRLIPLLTKRATTSLENNRPSVHFSFSAFSLFASPLMLLVHPTGNQFVRHLLSHALAQGRLELFATAVGFREGMAWQRWLPGRLQREIGRRAYSIPKEKLWTSPMREAARLTVGARGGGALVRHESGWASVDAVYGSLDAAVAVRLEGWSKAKGVSVVYGYEDGCLQSFRRSKDIGLTRAYDLPIAYWETSQRLLREEAQRLPAWEQTLGGTRDSREKLARKTAELELADVVVCPSSFVKDSLPAWARTKRVVVSPFGSPGAEAGGRRAEDGGQRAEDGGRRAEVGERRAEDGGLRSEGGGRRSGGGGRYAKRKLRVLFAGGMSQRKGLADLFAAVRLLNRSDVELVVMGSVIAPMEFYLRECPGFLHERTRPHGAVLALMRTCDVLVLPSIVEGRALVMQEAMSQGLPVIITPNTGGADLVDEGRTGFLVPIRAPEKLAEKIAWCADHRSEVKEMGIAAKAKAATYTWEAYAATILAALP